MSIKSKEAKLAEQELSNASMACNGRFNASKHIYYGAGQDIVFHVATAQYFGGEGSNAKNLMHGVNVIGTQNVIDACISQRVPKLIYTSSASVVFQGQSLIDVDESKPYATAPMDYYTGTKVSLYCMACGGICACFSSC